VLPVITTFSATSLPLSLSLTPRFQPVKVELVTELEDENTTVAKAAADLAEDME
jgi:hypothetical protein